MTALLLLALLQTDYAVAGEAWAREPVAAACYVELARRMDDPSAARDPEVRARLRESAQEMAGLAQTSFYEAATLRQKRDDDLKEKAALVSHGLMEKTEYDQSENDWNYSLNAHHYVLNRLLTTYPSCGFLRPLEWVPQYRDVIDAAMVTHDPPVSQ